MPFSSIPSPTQEIRQNSKYTVEELLLFFRSSRIERVKQIGRQGCILLLLTAKHPAGYGEKFTTFPA